MSNFVRRVGTLLVVAVMLLSATHAQATEYHGTVTFNGLPLPGATVTATQGEKKFSTSTGPGGAYSFADLPDGAWTIEIDMLGFTPLKQDVTVAAQVAAGTWDMKLMSLDQIRTQTKPMLLAVVPQTTAAGNVATSSASVTAAKTGGKAVPPAARPGGQAPPPPPPTEQQQASSSDGLLISGSVTNAATSQYSQAQRFGNMVTNGRRYYNFTVSLTGANSTFNANSYSLSGLVTQKPQTSRILGDVLIGGVLHIPRVLRNGPTFRFDYNFMRSTNASNTAALVPDPTGQTQPGFWNFSQAKDASGNPIVVYKPDHTPYANNTVPISPQAQYLLNLFPKPNVAGNTTYNYQSQLLSSTHADGALFTLNKGIGRENFNGGINAQSSRSSNNASIFNFINKVNVLNVSGDIGWTHRFGQSFFLRNLLMTTTYNFSRSRTDQRSFFGYRTDVSGQAGIHGNDTDPMNWGPPALDFNSGLQGLRDGQASYNRAETNAIGIQFSLSHGRHYFQFGGDVRRQQFNYLQQGNPRGNFGFTGAATADANGKGGSDFADFLVGTPDTSSLATGNPDKYLRQTVYDGYINDAWRMRPELTLNLGLRWEYGAPMTELKNRLVNLDIAPGFTAATPVLASSPTGTLTSQTYPQALIRPDRSRTNFGPSVALSWRPIPGSSLLVKASFGLYHDTSVYQQMTLQMAQQAPLSKSVSLQNTAACPLTLANGFPTNCGTSLSTIFAADPNFRVGYAEMWQTSAQRDLPFALQMTAVYTGTKGVHGVQQFLPNTYPAGGVNPCPSCPVGFGYRTSGGNLMRHEGALQLRRRLRSGFTASVLYKFAKSIDDNSLIGGQGAVLTGTTTQNLANGTSAQDWRHLTQERALSNGDQRHRADFEIQYTTGMGLHGGGSLLGGWRGAIYRSWSVVTNFSVGTGTPLTPVYPVVVPGTSSISTLRPNVTGADLYAAPAGKFLNSAAFAAPAAGFYGNARRNSITGPGTFTMNAQMARSFTLKTRYTLDANIQANNVLNHVTFGSYGTTIGTTQFGAPASPSGPRIVQGTLRLKF